MFKQELPIECIDFIAGYITHVTRASISYDKIPTFCVAFLIYLPYTLYPGALLRCPWEGVCMMDMDKVGSKGRNVGKTKKSF